MTVAFLGGTLKGWDVIDHTTTILGKIQWNVPRAAFLFYPREEPLTEEVLREVALFMVIETNLRLRKAR